MLLKLPSKKAKPVNKPYYLLILYVVFFTVGTKALADEFQVHGFIAQGVVQNKGSNFVIEDDELTFDLTELGLNFSYQLSDSLRFAGQAVYLNGGNRFDEGLRVDYLLADWNFYNSEKNQSHLYIGRIKNYHWLYSSTRDVPMTRPSIILPQSVYFDGTRDMSVGGDGIAFSNKYASENIGEIDLTISSSKAPIPTGDTRSIVDPKTKGRLKHDADLQASIYWRPVALPWRFGFALTDARFKYESALDDIYDNGEIDLQRFYLNAEYFGEKWSLSAELLQEKMALTGLLFPEFSRPTTGQGGYLQSEYKVTQDIQLLARYERYFADKNDKSGNQLAASTFGAVPYYFGFQHDVTLGLTYHFDFNLKLQFEHHWVQGTARLTPLIIPDPTNNPQEHWQLTALQLMYWF
ncbi:hypothetical protein [Thalassotalea agariperforans]